ncbi:GtrA family protein [Porphyrobacter sp. ULC335]|uniref:GtrA family protein n=1 Tax=Porphyrobacter sp. ULC335 TaxID=2854260 RepID=UPI00221F6749|nr:GtrA family protein [Porphyrobacter sp. ULC335]UYV15393.1 GtrA family protein [Porphyrobacter sp. ULC335]
MALLRQIASFGVTGATATLLHVGVAWLLIDRAALDGLVANACGAAAAFIVSYLGNARVTFASQRGLWNGAARYLVVTFASLALSSAILVLTQSSGLPTYAYGLLVVMTVPLVTFLLAKFWAFKRPLQQGEPESASGRA